MSSGFGEEVYNKNQRINLNGPKKCKKINKVKALVGRGLDAAPSGTPFGLIAGKLVRNLRRLAESNVEHQTNIQISDTKLPVNHEGDMFGRSKAYK